MFQRSTNLMALVSVIALLAGCSEDRPVYAGEADINDGGSAGTGGSDSGGSGGRAGDGGSSNGGSGGDSGAAGSSGGSGLPGSYGSGKQLFSFTITESDAYSAFSFYGTKNSSLRDCANSSSCMKDAKDDAPGRAFQWLATSHNYDEKFVGLAKAFCVYEKATSPSGRFALDAGYGCKVKGTSTSRNCLVSGVAVMYRNDGSVKQSVELGPSSHIEVGFENSDVASPFVFCHISEHRELFRIGGLSGYDLLASDYNYGSGTGSSSMLMAINGSEAIELESAFLGMAEQFRPQVVVENWSIGYQQIDLTPMIVPGREIVNVASF